MLGQTKTAKRIELADGSVLVLTQHTQAAKGEFKDVLTSGSSSLQDQGWVLRAEPSPGNNHDSQLLKADRRLDAEESYLSSKDHYSAPLYECLKNSQLYTTLLQALKQATLGRPKCMLMFPFLSRMLVKCPRHVRPTVHSIFSRPGALGGAVFAGGV